ncbi:hypothetical protein HYT00_03725 [Candidatus Giovannonibacteria bacterium]|nr:hypothetical protein [Candidatus Giovannonibacteria bacterium]
MKKNGRGFGKTTQKIILLLSAGVAMGLSRSPRQYFRILKSAAKEWERINERSLRNSIRILYKSKLIDTFDNPDGTTTIVLTENGRKKALTYQIDEINIKRTINWDRKWRIVVFDIPEKFKKSRDALSRTLKRMEFYQLQKSVFVHPFECKNEVDFIIEFFNIKEYVRYIIAEHIDNEIDLKRKFKL